MRRSGRVLRVALVAGGCVALDQVTKAVAAGELAGAPMRSFLHDALRLVLVHNGGAFLSLGTTLSDPARFWLFGVFNAALLAGILAYALWRRQIAPPSLLGLALIVGGGASNLVDRLRHDGDVVDFMNVGVGSWRTGIFNVADVAITLGAVVVVLAARRRPPCE